MDSKIQTYARRCEKAAKVLMALVIGNWLIKWVIDWMMYYALVWSGDSITTGCTSLADVLQKTPADQLHWVEPIDHFLRIDIGQWWFGLANLAKLPFISRALGFMIDGVTVAIIAIGFWLFIKLMNQLKNGKLFSSEMVELLNKLAKVIFWFAVYAPIHRTLTTLIITMNNPAGQRLLVIAIGFGDILALAVSWFFVLLTSLMRESQQLQAEHDTTV